jgi:hypothetical protein
MSNINISQVRVAVKTEVVPHFFMEVMHRADVTTIAVGDNCFIYDQDGSATKAICIGVNSEYTQYKEEEGVLHFVDNIEPDLNNHEFNRLLSTNFQTSEERSGYDQHIINRAISAKVIFESEKDEHEFTELGQILARTHFQGLDISNPLH